MKKLFSVLLVAMLVACLATALADIDGTVSGSNANETTFYVKVTSSGAAVTLQGKTGKASVSHGSSWDSPGVWYEDLYGFYQIKVTGPSRNSTYRWVASADSGLAYQNSSWYTDSSFRLTFSSTGVYTVTVSSITASSYLYDAYVKTWRTNPTWNVSGASKCTVSGNYPTVATATPAGTASKLTLDATIAAPGTSVTGTVTRYTVGASHSIEWVHQNGASFTQKLGTAYGSFITNIPSTWTKGYVYATLITTVSGREVGRNTATLYLNSKAKPTATPYVRNNPSKLTVNTTSVNAGGSVTLNITRYTTGVSHTIEWLHEDGSHFTTNVGTGYGTFNVALPGNWYAGTVDVILYTWLNNSQIGSPSMGTVQVIGRAPSRDQASVITLYNSQAVPGQTIGGYVDVYADSGVSHSIKWQHSNGSGRTTSWGSYSGNISFTVPTNWPAGTVTVTITTYRGSSVIGTNSTSFRVIYNGPTAKPTAAPTKRPKPTATPFDGTTLSMLKKGMIYPDSGSYQRPLGGGQYKIQNLNLDRLTDFDRSTILSYTMYDSCKSDDVPEMTFNFSYVDMGNLWIRVGKSGAAYSRNARPYKLRVKVYTQNGDKTAEYTFSKTLSDYLNADLSGFQKVDFKKMLHGVYKVEIFVPRIKLGTEDRNNVCIADVAFVNFR